MKTLYKIRIFKVNNKYHSCEEDVLKKTIIKDYTAWEEIDEETLNNVQQWILRKNEGYSDDKYILVLESEYNVASALKDYVRMANEDAEKLRLKEEKAKARKAQLEKERKNNEIKDKEKAIRDAKKLLGIE